ALLWWLLLEGRRCARCGAAPHHRSCPGPDGPVTLDSTPDPGTAVRVRLRRVIADRRAIKAQPVARCATMRYMSQPLSLRLPAATVQRLGARARHRRIAPRTLAQRYVEEGLRMDEHPLIRFVDGPAGRDARLVGSRLAVWQTIDVV